MTISIEQSSYTTSAGKSTGDSLRDRRPDTEALAVVEEGSIVTVYDIVN
jgi:hypothetical protein